MFVGFGIIILVVIALAALDLRKKRGPTPEGAHDMGDRFCCVVEGAGLVCDRRPC
jgi:hypothetical protein